MKTKYLLLGVLALCGCKSVLDAPPKLTRTTTGFEHPESALWDAYSRSWFVSNVAEFNTPGDGFLSRLDAQGRVMERRFVAGLSDPKGMAILDGVLYAADLEGIVTVDLGSREVGLIPVPGAIFLNDVVADDQRHTVYVSDSFGNAIFRVRDGVAEELLRSTELETPNGLALRDDTLFVASVGPNPDPETFIPSEPGRVWRVNIESRRIEPQTERIGGLDGLVLYGHELLVTDTVVGLYHVAIDGDVELYLDNSAESLAGAADIGFDPERRLLAVPQLFGDSVSFFRFRAGHGMK